ncbi:MAG: ribokinase [bacterium]|nr:ribokinase [bacterium]
MKISVVGSINMDMTVKTARIPIKGETVKGEDLTYIPGGKGANQAVAMAKLGASVEMFGCVGDDAAGKQLVKNLEQYGIVTKNIKTVKDVPTGVALITVGEKDNTIVVVAGANDSVTIPYIDSIKEDLLSSDLVLLQHEIPKDTVQYVIDVCYKAGIKVILNPAPARDVRQEDIEKVAYLTPNEHEAAILFGAENSLEDLVKAYPEKMIITMGKEGAIMCGEKGKVITVPAGKAKVVDTTGAGDTLNGAFAVQIAKGRTMEEALRFATTAASLSTETFGAQAGMPSYEEVERMMSNDNCRSK